MRLRLTRRALLAAAPAALIGCSSRERTIRLGAVTPGAMFQVPVLAAQELGYFREQGIRVELEEMASGARSMQALLSGSADVISPQFDQLLLMAAEDRGVRSFLMMQRCPVQVVAVSPVLRKPVRHVPDLKGATIGVTSPGSPHHLQLNYILKRGGVDPHEVSVIGLGSNAARVAALESGKVDAAVLGDPGATLLKRRYPHLVLLADTRTPEGTRQAFGADTYPGGVLIAREQWLWDNADQARGLATGVLKAMRWIRDTPAHEVTSRIPRQYRIEDDGIYTEAVQRLVPALSHDGIMPAHLPELVKRVLSTFDEKVRSANIDAGRTFTNEFVSGV
jgi:NitT/TauT family transport system substrate-binding protein